MGTKIKLKNLGSIFTLAPLSIFLSCAHSPKSDNLVSVDTALLQARSSYLLGCTEARVELKGKDAFVHCSNKAQKHLEDLENIMNQDLK